VEVLDALNNYAHNTKILGENSENPEQLSAAIFYALENEKKFGNAQSLKNVIEKLSNAARNIVSFAIDSNTLYGANYSLSFLGEAEDKESVDIVMQAVEVSADEWYHQLKETLQYVLFESRLARNQRKYVIEKTTDLNLSERFRLRLKELQRSSRVRYTV
jgi:hypothetical protein